MKYNTKFTHETTVNHDTEGKIEIFVNDLYKVWVNISDSDKEVNVRAFEFKHPTIETYNTEVSVNMPATGSYGLEKYEEYIELLKAVQETALAVQNLLDGVPVTALEVQNLLNNIK